MSNSSPYIFGKVPKLPAKYLPVVIPFFLSFLMSGIISLINLIHHAGLFAGFFSTWISAWAFSWIVAFPSVLILLPIVRRLSLLVVNHSAVK